MASNLTTGAFSCRYCSNSSSVRALPESARRTTGRLPVRSWIISASTRGSSTLSSIWRPALTWTVMPSSPKVTGSDLSRKPLTGIPFSFNSSIIRRTASGVMFGVGKVAADLQLIPGEHLGKGRTKTPAQRLIQGFSTAQADDDLSFCAVKLHAVHKHTANAAQNCWSAVNCGQTWVTNGFKWGYLTSGCRDKASSEGLRPQARVGVQPP